MTKLESDKKYRFKDNPKETDFHDKFIDMYYNNTSSHKTLSAIVNGWSNTNQNIPNEYLSEKEENICLNIIQWLGSSVGQSFINGCGFELKQ